MKRYIPIIVVISMLWMSCADVKDQENDDISQLMKFIENDIVLSLDVLDTEVAFDEEY